MDSDKAKDSSPSPDLWRLIGPASELSKKRCRLIYSSLGSRSDVCLFHSKGEFFAMDARCAHSGGPLCDGDIEDADDALRVFCPWHDYEFNIRTGMSHSGLQSVTPDLITVAQWGVHHEACIWTLSDFRVIKPLNATTLEKLKEDHRTRRKTY